MTNSKDNKTKVTNVPPLRFPGFTDEWKETSIGEVAPLQRGFDLPTQQLEEGEYPVVYSNGIMNHHASYKCKAPGIITGRSGTVGKFTYIDDGYYWPHNTSLWVTGFFDNNPKFIYYLYQTIRIEQYSTGSGVPTLNRNDVHRHKVRIPKSIDEQNKIARLLSILDERIATQNKIIEDLKKLKSAIIDSVIGESDFPKIRFEEIYDRAGEGGTPATSTQEYYLNGKIPFVKIEDLANKYLVSSKDFITELGLCKSSTWVVPINSIIYSNGATIGAISINKIPVCTKQGILGIVPKEKYHVEYLYYLMTTTYFRKQIERIVTEGTMRTAYLKDINHIECPIPDLETQKKIASMFGNLSNKLELEQSILTNHTNQKRFFLSSMFI